MVNYLAFVPRLIVSFTTTCKLCSYFIISASKIANSREVYKFMNKQRPFDTTYKWGQQPNFKGVCQKTCQHNIPKFRWNLSGFRPFTAKS